MRSMRIIEPTGNGGDLLAEDGHRFIEFVDPDDVGTYDFFVEHGVEVEEEVRDPILIQPVLDCGQQNQRVVLG